MTQDLGTVDPDPVKCRVREPVDIVPIHPHQLSYASHRYVRSPAELLCEKVFHTCSPHDLWERASKPEAIWQPPNATSHAEARLEVALAVDKLPRERLAGWHVGVVFDPRTTNRIEFSFEYLLADPLKERWVELLKPLVLLGRGTPKAVFRIVVHEVNLCRP